MDLGVREGDSCILDVNTSSLPKRIPQKKVPGNSPQRPAAGSFPELGAVEERSEKGSNLDTISLHPVEYGRTHVSSRKLLATGRWGNVPGKVQIRRSHITSGIRVSKKVRRRFESRHISPYQCALP